MSKKNNSLHDMIFKNRYSLISLIVILAMYLIASTYYKPDSAIRIGTSSLTGGKVGLVGGTFTMRSQNGDEVTESILNGKTSLLFFGFTHCPDICPTALAELAAIYDALPKNVQKNIQVIFVTLDPERDTREHLEDYVGAFHETFIGLRGNKEQTREITKNYAVYYNKTATDEHGDYSINHTGFIYMMGQDGEYIQHFPHKNSGDDILRALMTAYDPGKKDNPYNRK